MTILQVIEYGAKHGTELTETQVKEFFAKHDGTPSVLQLAQFVGALPGGGKNGRTKK